MLCHLLTDEVKTSAEVLAKDELLRVCLIEHLGFPCETTDTIFTLLVSGFNVIDIDLNELCEGDCEGSLLEGVVLLEEIEKGFEIHRQFFSQILDYFIHITDVNQINSL